MTYFWAPTGSGKTTKVPIENVKILRSQGDRRCVALVEPYHALANQNARYIKQVCDDNGVTFGAAFDGSGELVPPC